MRAERRARRVTQWLTSAALVAWLLLLLRWHAWDLGLVAEDWRVELALLRGALALSALAATGELSLARDRGRASWVRLVLALLPLALLCERWWHPSEHALVAGGFVIVAAVVIGFGSPSARVRVSALMLGGVLCIGALEDLHFHWRGTGALSAAVARSFANSYWLQRMPLAAAVIGFGSALGSRRIRWQAAAGFLLALGAGVLEILGTVAARQVEAAARSDGVFPITWSIDEIAMGATFVEVGLVAVLVFMGLARLVQVARRRERSDSRGTAAALTLTVCVTFAAQSPVRAPVHPPSPVPLAEAEPWRDWYHSRRDHPMGAQVLTMSAGGRTTSYYGRRPMNELRFAPLARVELYPDRHAPAAALERALRRLLRQVRVVRIGVRSSDARYQPVPGAAARARYPFAVTLTPHMGLQRALRSGAAQGDYEVEDDWHPCPAIETGESVGAYLARRPASCVVVPSEHDVTIAAPLAPIGDLPSWRRSEPRRPLPLLIGALLGLAAALLFGQLAVQRDLRSLRGRRKPAGHRHRNARVHPPWLWRREATHWWGRSAAPYRDRCGFLGPRDQMTARRALRRRAWRIAGRVVWAGLLWSGVMVLGALLGLLGTVWL